MKKRGRRRDKDTKECSDHWAAKAPRLPPYTPPVAGTCHQLIPNKERKRTPGLLDLPDTVLLQILSYLPVSDLVLGARQTCKRLHVLSRSACLWTHVTLHPGATKSDEINPHFYGMVSQTCHFTQHLEGNGKGGTVPQVVEDSVWKRVTSLTEYFSFIHNAVVANSIIQNPTHPNVYPRLQRLVLKLSMVGIGFDFLHQHLQLRSLTIDGFETGCYFQRIDSSFPNLFCELKPCKNLRTLQLQIDNPPQRWPTSVDSFKDIWMYMKDYFQTGPALTRLRLDIPVNDDMFTTIMDCCEQLKDLQLSNGYLSRRVFKKTLECPNITLTALRLKGCALTDLSIAYAIPRCFQSLQQLELSLGEPEDHHEWMLPCSELMWRKVFLGLTVLKLQIRGEDLSYIQRSIQHENDAGEPLPNVMCPASPIEPGEGRLEELHLEDDAFRWQEIEHIHLHPHLRSLVVTSPTAPKDSGSIPDNALQALVQSCQQLQHVDLCGYKMSATGLAFFRTLPHLKTLHGSVYTLQDHLRISDPPPGGEDARESSLRQLQLAWHNVTCEDLRALCAYFPGLASLNLNTCHVPLTDCHMKIIVSALPYLKNFAVYQSICLPNVERLSYRGLRYLLTFNRQLLNVTWIVPLGGSKRQLVNMVLRHPTLRSLVWDPDGWDSRDLEDLEHSVNVQLRRLNCGPPRLVTATFGRLYAEREAEGRSIPPVITFRLCVHHRRRCNTVAA